VLISTVWCVYLVYECKVGSGASLPTVSKTMFSIVHVQVLSTVTWSNSVDALFSLQMTELDVSMSSSQENSIQARKWTVHSEHQQIQLDLIAENPSRGARLPAINCPLRQNPRPCSRVPPLFI
jgi:hypothetical protein